MLNFTAFFYEIVVKGFTSDKELRYLIDLKVFAFSNF